MRNSERPNARDLTGPGRLLVGANYHPHDSGPETWRRDAAMMRDAGITVVRLGHLAWDTFEPQMPPRLLLALLLFFLLLLLDGAKPGRPGRPPRDERSLGLLVHRVGIPRGPVAARPITNGNGIPLDPRSGRLRGSLLPLGPRRLGLFWRRRGRLARQGTRWGALGADRQLRVGGACETKNKGQSQ
jgi:hypothetical protein